jgi:hexosaminidase
VLNRGVKVIPELDTPGHTFPSWGAGGPANLLTSCPAPNTNNTGPLRADREETYAFLSTLLSEVAIAFPGEIFHAGGDEVSFECWGANPEIMAWMEANGMGSNLTLLNSYYVQKLLNIVQA